MLGNGRMCYSIDSGPQVLSNDNGPPVLGNGPHVLGIMSHSALCHIRYYVVLISASYDPS